MPHKDPMIAKDYWRRYNLKNKERRKLYLDGRKDHNKELRRNYYLAHREQYLEATRKWKLAHPDHYKKWAGDYYKKHPDKANAWHKKDPERSRRYRTAYSRKWRESNRPVVQERIRARKSKCSGSKSARAFYTFVRSKDRITCYYCGEWVSGKEAHIDHVIALSKNGNHASENLCASCPKCNLKKRAKLPSETAFNNQPLLNL